jgi:hypothetical protein
VGVDMLTLLGRYHNEWERFARTTDLLERLVASARGGG